MQKKRAFDNSSFIVDNFVYKTWSVSEWLKFSTAMLWLSIALY